VRNLAQTVVTGNRRDLMVSASRLSEASGVRFAQTMGAAMRQSAAAAGLTVFSIVIAPFVYYVHEKAWDYHDATQARSGSQRGLAGGSKPLLRLSTSMRMMPSA
jgi:uncharacterized membrane protein